jgi:hypothetical protein
MILLSAFVLVLCAGVVVGRLWNQLPVETKAPTSQPSWLADELQLQPEQREKMDALWTATKAINAKSFERRQALDRERDQAIQQLLTPAEWMAYDKIIEDFRTKRAALDKERHQLMDETNEKSMALLNDDQKHKWEELRNWRGPHGAGPTTRQTNQ